MLKKNYLHSKNFEEMAEQHRGGPSKTGTSSSGGKFEMTKPLSKKNDESGLEKSSFVGEDYRIWADNMRRADEK